MKRLLTGNEAVARGAYEAGVLVAAAYPGTPNTEILENISQYKEIKSEWSTNEKVALEVASGIYSWSKIFDSNEACRIKCSSRSFIYNGI